MRQPVRRVEKPWGHELIVAHTDRYVGKILHIEPGHALSLQYHERKDETFFVARGAIDQAALIAALKAKTIKGAALDVYDDEPGVPDERVCVLHDVRNIGRACNEVERVAEHSAQFGDLLRVAVFARRHVPTVNVIR